MAGESGVSERYPSESALHTYNAIITMPLSRTQLAALLIALHESAGCRPPPMSVAWAMCARGRLRALKQLRRIPAFGRRRQTRLRKVFAAPDFHQHLTSQLQVITAQAPDIPEHPPLPNLNLAHPFGEAAWFEPVVARLLGLLWLGAVCGQQTLPGDHKPLLSQLGCGSAGEPTGRVDLRKNQEHEMNEVGNTC